MAYSDIQRLRQQYVFSPVEDITGGDMGYLPMGGDMGGGYEMPDPYEIPRASASPAASAGMPQQASSGQAGMGAPPVYTPPTPESTIPRWDNGPPQTQGPADPNASIQQTMDAINKVYTPETVDRDRLRKLMDAAPVRERPSLARAIVAGGLSIKAQDPIAASEAVMYAPHRRNMADWTAKADPFYKTADLENRANVNERTLAGNVVTSVTQANKLSEQARQADQKNEVATVRARAYAAKNSGWTVIKAGDRLVAVNPQTKERQDLGPSGGLNREEELNIIGEWGVQKAEASGKAALDRIIAAGGQIVVNPDGTLRVVNPRTTPPTSTSIPSEGGPGTPTKLGTPRAGGTTNTLETRRQRNDMLEDRYRNDPTSRKYIKKNQDNTYSLGNRPVVGPDTSWFGDNSVTQEDVDAYDALQREINPAYVPPKPIKPGNSGLGPTGSVKGKDIDLDSGPGIGPSPSTGVGITIPPDTRQRAIDYLIQHNLKPTEANIAHAVRSGRLTPRK